MRNENVRLGATGVHSTRSVVERESKQANEPHIASTSPRSQRNVRQRRIGLDLAGDRTTAVRRHVVAGALACLFLKDAAHDPVSLPQLRQRAKLRFVRQRCGKSARDMHETRK